MEDFALRRPLDAHLAEDANDDFYGNQELQVDMHNGEVHVEFPNGEWILAIFTSLTAGIEGSGNYIVFHNDRIILIADGNQLGVEQYVVLRPDPSLYSFIPTLSADVKRTSRIILRTNFSNVKQTLTRNKPTKTKKRSLVIHKKRIRAGIDVHTQGDDGASAADTVTCSVVSRPPQPHDLSNVRPTWVGTVAELNEALSGIFASKADTVYTYIKTNGEGVYFYAYHATSGCGSRGRLGSVLDDDFQSSEKNISLVPVAHSQYLTYRLTRRGLKTLQKLNAEKPGQVELRCVSETIIALSCTILDENNTHTYYFSSPSSS